MASTISLHNNKILTLSGLEELVSRAKELGLNPDTRITITSHADGYGEDCLETVNVDDVCFWEGLGDDPKGCDVIALRPIKSLVTAESIET